MRHGIKTRKLNRTSAHRKALLKNLSIALIQNKAIRTTLPKAKELRPYLEKLVTKAGQQSVAARRHVSSHLNHPESVKSLVDTIAPKYKQRPGGYLRIIKNGYRNGDKAPMAIVSWVE